MTEQADLGSICQLCAWKFGCKPPKGHMATAGDGICPYCDKSAPLCSTGDYDWPDGKPRGMRD